MPLFLNCLADANLHLVLPANGSVTASGQIAWELNAGDIIAVSMAVPFNNTAGLRFGQDNVSLNYIGRLGTQWVGQE